MSEKSALPGSGKEPGKMSTIGELFSRLSDQLTALVKGEVALAKLRAMNTAKRLGSGVAALVVAVVLALFMFGVLLHAAIMGLAEVMPEWAAALVVAAVLLLIVVIIALVGASLLRKAMREKPNPKAGIEKAKAATMTGLQRGLAENAARAEVVDTEVTIVSRPSAEKGA